MTETYDLRARTGAAGPGAVPADKFPSGPFALASSYSAAYFQQFSEAASSIDSDQVDRAAALLVDAFTKGATVFSCGNGGSASIANHMQCDHLKGVSTGTDLAPKVVSLSTNVELLTAIANDLAYEEIFRHQMELQSRPGDLLVAISSSGRSPNIVNALEWCRDHGRRTIALTGFDGGAAKLCADVAVHVECSNYGIIEDVHQAVMHLLAQYVRQSRMTPGTVSITTF